MKHLLLSTAAFALLLTTACTSTTTEETNINATDTVNMLPPADNTGPGIEGANPNMVDPNAVEMNGSSTGGNDASNSSNSTGGSTNGIGTTPSTSNSSRGGSNSGTQEVMVPAAPAKDDIKSTYKRAAPGDTVDARTNIGSSR